MRPEHTSPPEYYYDEKEANKYSCNSRIIKIQREMALRAFELLALPVELAELEDHVDSDSEEYDSNEERESGEETDDSDEEMEEESEDCSEEESDDEDTVPTVKEPYFILDIGVGSGLCASMLSRTGCEWVGVDISPSMLDVALKRQQSKELGNGDLMQADMGQGFSYFRPGSFDGAISISALQWVFSSYSPQHAKKQLKLLFMTLYSCLSIGSRAVFQFYPEHSTHIDMILQVALQTGFTGGLVIDYPESSKNKKYFLVLMVGQTFVVPEGKTSSGERRNGGVMVYDNEYRKRRKVNEKHTKAWVLHKKDLFRRRGYESVPRDSKYTARKRKPKF